MNKTNNKFVTNINNLIELIKEGHIHYAIVLDSGLGIYSRKTIDYNKKTKRFVVINHIDNSTQILTKKQIMNPNYTNISKAIPLNCLICVIE